MSQFYMKINAEAFGNIFLNVSSFCYTACSLICDSDIIVLTEKLEHTIQVLLFLSSSKV